MKHCLFLLVFIPSLLYGQKVIETKLIIHTPIQSAELLAIDNFETRYHVTNNTLYKTTETATLSYHNFQLGNLTTINVFNPLKTVLFYKDFNTVILLDNRLSEIFKIDFNTIQPYKNILLASPGNDNHLWLFNLNTQAVERFDFKHQETKAKTLPINDTPLDLISDYNYCWLLTETHLYKYNYFGSLVYKIENKGYKAIKQFNGRLFVLKGNTLLTYLENDNTFALIETPDLLIKQFFVTGESLYLYTDKTLSKFHLKL
ncbi:hypothetical protein IA57_02680 [Mangrovimonas yunxiaonensis]|uniref:Uncharacterized protein n=1 Tax=Mangrovimonas yunxiaonensis TaxID=1197477 RepID=A0A084TM62_9FLAO|nr:hypothetical protein [Mangrovimonas yunxiaonensis]KFB01798.1 hypothetical protein IA57_02680 [Mangrovimonas yunxiaonensis]